MARSAVFIDGGYLNALLREEFNTAKIDYQALVRVLVEPSELLRAYYYHCAPYQSSPPTEEERKRFSQMDSFFNYLRRLSRFEVRQGKLSRYYDEDGKPVYKQKGVDVLLGIELALLAAKRRIEYAVLLTGDNDLIPAVQTARDEGVVVHLYHGLQYGRALWDICDDRTQIDEQLISSVLFKDDHTGSP